MEEPFEKAKKSLKITSVNLRNSFISLDDEVEPFELKRRELDIETFRTVSKITGMCFESKDRQWWEYNFFYAVGVRLVPKTNDTSNTETNPLLEIKDTFNALYQAKEELDNDVLDAFAEQNVGYHVWSYWRELVQSFCTRLSITPIEIPFYFCK